MAHVASGSVSASTGMNGVHSTVMERAPGNGREQRRRGSSLSLAVQLSEKVGGAGKGG